MRLQSTTPSFYGRVDINKLRTTRNVARELNAPEASVMSSLTTGASTVSAGLVAGKTVGMASEVASTAFVSKAAGVNSSGIVPAIIETATPHVTPATIAASNNHPSAVGAFFSTVGQFFDKLSSTKVNIKNPS